MPPVAKPQQPAELTPQIGSQLLDQLGFLHVPGPPLSASRAYLFVALRRRPTLDHFDPERIDYWQTLDGRGAAASLEWSSRAAADAEFAWGSLRIVDRLNVANDYVCFGGHLAVARSPQLLVAVFSSSAPILAGGGHSQGWDPTAEEVAGYLARLRAAAGASRELERRLAMMSPPARYAGFIADALARFEAAGRVVSWRPLTQTLLRHEARRLRNQSPADWSTGEALARELR
jgi:hypothetical protein